MHTQSSLSAKEQERAADLLRLLPTGRHSVLDIGAREGYFSRLLTEHFAEVTALDLTKPGWDFPGVVTVAGDVTGLQFPDQSFDVVFCAEVLEHVPDVERACAEIARVVRHEAIIGVPYRQDIRHRRRTCAACGTIYPPWNHVNSFDEDRIRNLFPSLRVVRKSFVGTSRAATNPLSVFLMDVAGNPWGVYIPNERCSRCNALLVPRERGFVDRICSSVALGINQVQFSLTRPHPNWIHLLFAK